MNPYKDVKNMLNVHIYIEASMYKVHDNTIHHCDSGLQFSTTWFVPKSHIPYYLHSVLIHVAYFNCVCIYTHKQILYVF